MSYSDLLYEIKDYALILYPLTIVTLLAAILGTTRVFRAAFYSVVLFVALTFLAMVLFPRAGMGMLGLLLIIGELACALFIFSLAFQYYRKKPTFRLNPFIRTTFAVASIFLLLINVTGVRPYEIIDSMRRQAVLAGDITALDHWDRPFDSTLWEAIAERPQGPETLQLIQSLIEAKYVYPKTRIPNEGYVEYVDTTRLDPIPLAEMDKDVWPIILMHPASEQRLSVIRALTLRYAPPAFFLADLYDQKDKQGFAITARCVASSPDQLTEVVNTLIRAERHDVVDALVTIAASTAQPTGASPQDAAAGTAK